MKDSHRSRWAEAIQQYTRLEKQLTDPEILADRDHYRKLAGEHARLRPIAELYRNHESCARELAALDELHEDADTAIREMAVEERTLLQQKMSQLEQEAETLLTRPAPIPADRGAFLEIRAGTGGDEAALFAGDLFRMYSRYAERSGWVIKPLTHHEGEHGGFREIVVQVSGQNAYARLQFESGTHRVQRIPKTESQGRIHTSAATVAVFPEPDPVAPTELNADDLRVDCFRASGSGGQHLNKTDSAVRITHLPTGLVVECQDDRSQHRNKAQAMSLLHARLSERQQREQREAQDSLRRGMIGSGDRSERIRTYNFPQGRITDHRIGLTLHSLQKMLEGDLDPLIEPLLREAHDAP